jgi:DNA-binding MarR family transcriptional regulator
VFKQNLMPAYDYRRETLSHLCLFQGIVPVKETYFETIRLIERLHRQFLEVVKVELDRTGIADINNIQALILSNIGKEELTVGELTNRGYYLGSNVSYNVKKMVENDYLEQERSPHDRRSVRVRVSPKGLEVCELIAALHERHISQLADSPLSTELEGINTTLMSLERFWTDDLRYGARSAPVSATGQH